MPRGHVGYISTNRYRLVTHDHVDVGTLIETVASDGPLPMAHLVKNAHVRSVAEITNEIRAVQTDTGASRSGVLMRRFGAIGARIPGLWMLMYAVMGRSIRLRRSVGTVSVTSVGMFGGGGGHGISFPTVLSLGISSAASASSRWSWAARWCREKCST